jgi:L-ribulose-5-phosphate 4-epimerase
MKNHGVFTLGKCQRPRSKAAVMVEDVARTVWLALQIGQPEELPAEEVAANYDRINTGTARRRPANRRSKAD